VRSLGDGKRYQPRRFTLSWQELAAREEGGLRLPGSRLVDEVGYNEGKGWGFDGLQKSAMYQTHWTVDAATDGVHEWFRRQLNPRGWELHSSQRGPVDAPTEADFYRRRAAHFILRVWQENGTTHYDITLSDSSPPTS
jgi:hypothetical protein